ncbi:MAG: PKD domain-containing protein, partial [Gammaproteobacteria bacterium]|nr:PKD domain-containing protein [Gammaproteobacteria bacterium]
MCTLMKQAMLFGVIALNMMLANTAQASGDFTIESVFASPSTSRVPSTITLAASMSTPTPPLSDTLIYEWSTASGGIVVTGNPAFMDINIPGEHVIALTVTDAVGHYVTAAAYSVVNVLENISPTARLTIDPVDAYDLPAPVTVNLDASNSSDHDGGEVVGYRWTASNGASYPAQAGQYSLDSEAAMILQTEGSYTITLTVIDNGGKTGTDFKNIQVGPTEHPTALFEMTPDPASGLAPVSVALDGSGSYDPLSGNAGIVQYAWVIRDASNNQVFSRVTGNSSADAVLTTRGTHRVSLTVTNEKGLSTSTQQSLYVKTYQSPVAAASVFPITGPAPLQVSLNASGSHDDGWIASYEWFSSDGQRKTGRTPAPIIYNQAGTYTLNLTVTDDDGLTATDVTTVYVDIPIVLLPPVAIPNVSPISGGEPLTVQLNGSSSYDPDGTITSYEWTSGGETLFGASGSMIFTNGTHTITLTVTDNDGLTHMEQRTVVVLSPPPPQPPVVISVVSPLSDTIPFTVQMNGGSSYDTDGTITGHEWFLNGSSVSTSQSHSLLLDSDGTHVITLRVTDNDGMTSEVQRTVVADPQPPNRAPMSVPVVSPLSGTVPFTLQLNGGSAYDEDGTITSYEWFVDGSSVSTSQNASYTFNSEGIYAVALEVIDEKGLSSGMVQRTVIANSPPPPQSPVAISVISPLFYTVPFTLQLNGSNSYDTDGTIAGYEWFLNGGSVSTSTSHSLLIENEGIYTVKLIVTDNDGLTHEIQRIVEGGQPPPNQSPVAVPVVSPLFGTVPFTVQLNGTPSYDPDGSIASYLWASTGQAVSGATGPMSFDSAGTYIVSLTVTDNDGLTHMEQRTVVALASLPNVPPAAILSVSPLSGSVPLRVQLDGNNSYDTDGTLTNYEWFLDGPSVSTSPIDSLVINTEGTHMIKLRVTDNTGAAHEVQRTVNVD